METYHHSITRYLYDEFEKSAIAYLRTGLEMFHKTRKLSSANCQPSIGNLGIAIELMLKTLIVKHNPILLFTGLPDGIQVLFSCPESLPKDFNWRIFDIELRSFKYGTKELDECIGLFYTLMPEHKQELSAHFKLLSRIRNASVHSVLPSFQRYELERLAYLALRLFSILKSAKALSSFSYSETQDDKEFMLLFNNERIERVRKKINEATEKSKQIKAGKAIINVEGWEEYTTECPICKSNGVLTGYTDIRFNGTPDNPEESLEFFADSFVCNACGLTLEDPAELERAGMELYYDRSDELESWYEEHTPDYSEYA